MLRLAMSEVRANVKSWMGAGIVVCATSALLALSFGMVTSGAAAETPAAAEAYSSVGGIQSGFIVLTSLVCVGVAMRLTVRGKTRTIASWQLAGVTPRTATCTMFVTLVLVIVCGSALGGGIGVALWRPFTGFIRSAELPVIPQLSQPLSTGALLGGCLTGAVAALVSATSTLRSVMRVEAVEAVRQSAPSPDRRRAWGRVLAVLVLSTCLVAAYVGIAATGPSLDMEELGGMLTAYWGTGLLLISLVAVADRLVIRPVLLGWTRLVPLQHWTPWSLAREMAGRRVDQSSAVILPLMLAGGAAGAVAGMLNQVRHTMVLLGGEDVAISPPRQFVLLFGGPVIIAFITTVCIIGITSSSRARDTGLLSVAGLVRRDVLALTVCEYAVYAGTTLILCYGSLCVNGLAMAAALDRGPVPGAQFVPVGWAPLLIIAGGFALGIIPTVFSTQATLTRSPIEVVQGK